MQKDDNRVTEIKSMKNCWMIYKLGVHVILSINKVVLSNLDITKFICFRSAVFLSLPEPANKTFVMILLPSPC